MPKEGSLLSVLIGGTAKVLGRIADLLGDPAEYPLRTISFLRELGWDIPLNADLSGSDLSFLSAVRLLKGLAEGEIPQFDDLITGVTSVLEARHALVDDLDLELDTEFEKALTNELPHQLVDYAIISFLNEEVPAVHGLLAALGIIVVVYEPPEPPYRIGYMKRVMKWAALQQLICEPARFAEHSYGWGTSTYDGSLLLDALEYLFRGLGLRVGRLQPAKDLADLRVIAGESLYTSLVQWSDLDIGLELYRVAGETGEPDEGLVLAPYVIGETEAEMQVLDSLTLGIESSIQLARNIGIELHGHGGTSAFGIGALTPPDGEVSIRILIHPPNGIFELGDPASDRLSAASARVTLTVVLKDGSVDLAAEFKLGSIQLVLGGEDGDSFIRSILSGTKIEAEFDLVFGLRTGQGVYLQSSGAFDLSIPIHRTLGPITIDSVYLSLGWGQNSSPLILAASIGANLGPVSVSIQRLGVSIALAYSESNGRSSLSNIDAGFHPPTGAGLMVAAGPITGGGYLDFDNTNKRYYGILQLQFGEIGLTAIGLITTRMPDGSDGFSMLIIINVEFTPAIQLSFAFTLSAVGGLIGINRTMVLEALRAGVRNRTLDSVLFPQDPINNASRIISDLRTVFPPEEGRFAVGPMLRLGWGSPKIITAELAVIIELPSPVRIAIIGQLAAAFPGQDEALVVLHLDVLGIIDFGAQLLSIDATLYDSRVLAFSLSGDAALRLKWGDNPQFAMSLGGFHPKFPPPPNFPTLRRLQLSLGSSDNPRFNCEHYQALTPNSLQFGARVDVYAKFCGAKIHGYLGFDALFYFSPFHFDVSISGGVEIRFKGHKLAAVRLRLELSGPTPWHAKGKATFEILWWDVKVRFNKTWGQRASVTIEAVSPWDEFVAALNRPASWGSALPAGRSMVEPLRSLDEEPSSSNGADATSSGTLGENGEGTQIPAKPLIVHPAGNLEVRQKVLPLQMRLYKFGNAPIAGPHTFDVGPNTEETITFELSYLEGYFARGQYEELSNSEKVSKPSYESFKAGVTIRSTAIGFDGGLAQEHLLEYESEYIDEDTLTKKGEAGTISGDLVRRLLIGAATRKSPLRMTGRQKYARIGKATKIAVHDEHYTIVQASDMTVVTELSDNDGSLTRMAADEVLRTAVAGQPGLDGEFLVVSSYEVAV